MSVHGDYQWFIDERDSIAKVKWDGRSCPACRGAGRIVFRTFCNWTCICGGRYLHSILSEWWKHEPSAIVDYTAGIKSVQAWLRELVRRWEIESKQEVE